ncbi:flagellin [Henriciella sp. AS95]|uniref:flagellin n=1 Tax=Henriciella sp. AS95 TaxID=3135782 RepID=UPI0031798A6A
MSSILTNTSSMVALETLRNINRNLETVQSEISTGKKVSSAKDNSSIWAISTVMSTDVQSFKQITDTLNKGSSVVGVARTASEQVTGLLQEMKELIVSAQEDLNTDDRAKIQTDIDAKRTAIGNIVSAAQFGGQNLLKGTDSINVLASLDRASDGTVSATNISVSRNDLQTNAAADAAAKTDGEAGYISTDDTPTENDVTIGSGEAGYVAVTGLTSDVTATDGSAVLTFTDGELSVGDVFTLDVSGTTFSVEVTDADTTVAEVVAKLADDITASHGTTPLTNFDSAVAGTSGSDSTLTLAASSGNALTVENIDTTRVDSVIEDTDSVEITVDGGSISTGDTFSITVGGSTVNYTALEGDTANEVAKGLADAIGLLNSGSGITNLDVDYTEASDPTSEAATITFTADGGDVDFATAGLVSNNVAVAAGGLGALADLSVSTSTEATTALNTIEDLLSTAIDAATSFGSAQKQIEGQSAFVQSLIDSMTSGIGTMVDADIEAASAKLQALQVQQQLGIQALSIANGQPQTLLALFR